MPFPDSLAARRAGLLAGRSRTFAKLDRNIRTAPPLTRQQRDHLIGLLHVHPVDDLWPASQVDPAAAKAVVA